MIKSKEEKKIMAIGKRGGWLTEDGGFDITKFPIDGALKKLQSDDFEEFRSGVDTLRAMQKAGRFEAGVFLMGSLMNTSLDELKKRIIIVEALENFKTRGCADLLFYELKRVKSSNVTKKYINTILKTLSGFDMELIRTGFEELINDKNTTYRMKNKFKEIIGIKVTSDEDYDFFYKLKKYGNLEIH